MDAVISYTDPQLLCNLSGLTDTTAIGGTMEALRQSTSYTDGNRYLLFTEE